MCASVCECMCGVAIYLMEIYDSPIFLLIFRFEQVLAMWGVLRFYNLVRSGITWRGPEVRQLIITLWPNGDLLMGNMIYFSLILAKNA